MDPESFGGWGQYILPFIVPALTALILFVKKQGVFDAKGALTEQSVISIRQDLSEVKNDIKEVRKEQIQLNAIVQELKNFNQRIKRLEDILDDHDKRLWPQLGTALRQIDTLGVRVSNVEEQLKETRYQLERRSSRFDALGAQRRSRRQYDNNGNDSNNNDNDDDDEILRR